LPILSGFGAGRLQEQITRSINGNPDHKYLRQSERVRLPMKDGGAVSTTVLAR